MHIQYTTYTNMATGNPGGVPYECTRLALNQIASCVGLSIEIIQIRLDKGEEIGGNFGFWKKVEAPCPQ